MATEGVLKESQRYCPFKNLSKATTSQCEIWWVKCFKSKIIKHFTEKGSRVEDIIDIKPLKIISFAVLQSQNFEGHLQFLKNSLKVFHSFSFAV